MSNYVIEKQSRKVIWINPDPNPLSGSSAWGNYDPTQHEIVFALHYNPQIGEVFNADIESGCAKEFSLKTVYDKITKTSRVLQSWDDKILDSETESTPLKDETGEMTPYQIYGESGWVIDLDQAREYLIRSVDAICESKIVSGFFSSALGAYHFYGSDRDDQLNLIGAASLRDSVLFKCTDQNGAKAYRLHSETQIGQVLHDGAIRKSFLLQRNSNLKALIQVTTSMEELSLIDIQSGWDEVPVEIPA
ncbi:hypothetical protein EHQ12_04025 [Leptospira gomenensis]|uniref:Uncharacterized protein n=1 Tax=Leptospira gomenensis TaxID=2484974 RepID=A0A5F1YHR7_9LEPT|nr:hypothetical protein [Leptospira gomenensis]TGK36215.1 hypothetical protein EHQ17_04695 [Leptospira gomenensis]TGK42747.1 hypothetical protein EHQ07_13805 [Leptospira gomenensis]TGK42934.1 hypothetical protein EHQ12_04025 [Leptospira gomenensis]TGK54946.1 hypothetical protein EHQ13_18280 [Leptospira gomenensis]